MRLLLILASLATVTTVGTPMHRCPFEHCPYKGDVSYMHKHTGDTEPADDIASDCDMLDRVHWDHPTWDYDQCEEAIFNPNK
jgi:hypothetical protein